MSFKEFLIKNCGNTIIISFLVFKLFSIIFEELCNPIILMIADPNGELRQHTFSIGNQQIRYGVVLTYLIVFLLLIYSVYVFSMNQIF
jgi:large-conductance mechanosensitive channel